MLTAALLLLVLAEAPPESPPASDAVTGRVIDADDRPLAEVEVFLSRVASADNGRPVLSRGRTDHAGRFRLEVAEKERAAAVPWAVWAVRPGRALAAHALRPQSRPPEKPPTLTMGPPVRARLRVLGPEGKAVAGARVRPLMLRISQGLPPNGGFPVPDELAERLEVRSDADGLAEFEGFARADLQSVAVEARGFGRQNGYVGSRGDEATMTLLAAGRITGRLVAEDPAAARGLRVLIFTWSESDGTSRPSGEALATADAEGRFEVPEIAGGTIHATVELPKGSDLHARPRLNLTLAPGGFTELVIPLEGPRRERTLSGRVRDRRGEPVAGAIVWQTGDARERTTTTADDLGRFRLPGVSAGRAFLFARKQGFRFAWQPVGGEASEVTLTMTKADEAPERALATLPPVLPHEQELSLARRVLAPYADRVLKQGGEAERVRTLEALARVDPGRTLELIEAGQLREPYLKEMVRSRVAEGMLDESPEEAIAIFESVENPGFRAIGLLAAADALPEAQRARKLELVDRALVDARAAREPTGIGVILRGNVAEHWLDMGEADRAERLLREVLKEAEQLPNAAWAAYAKGAFAEELAQVDPKAALELTKDLSDPRELDRHRGNIAHELAGRNPAEAERVLAMVRDGSQRDQYAVRVAYRMAAIDRDRARRLVESIKDAPLRGYGLAMMALGLAHRDRRAAEGLLHDAFEALDRAAQLKDGDVRSLFTAAGTASALLPVAEQIDPRLVPEALGRTLALRPPLAGGQPNAHLDAQLALMIARFDRETARTLLEPLTGLDGPALLGSQGVLSAAKAVVDPRQAVEHVDAMPDDPDLNPRQHRNAARLAVANVLARKGERRSRYLQYHYLYLWVPDIEDIAANL